LIYAVYAQNNMGRCVKFLELQCFSLEIALNFDIFVILIIDT
jgi:hypothetical protein